VPTAGQHGKAAQIDPIKTTLKAPGIKRLKLECDKLLSSFAFKYNFCRYNMVPARELTKPSERAEFMEDVREAGAYTRSLFSST